MTWKQLVFETVRQANIDEPQAEAVLNAFFDVMINAAREEETLELRPDFGAFKVRESGGEALSGHRPQIIKRQRKVVFKTANALQKALRQSDEDYLDMLKAMGAADQARAVRIKMDQNAAAKSSAVTGHSGGPRD